MFGATHNNPIPQDPNVPNFFQAQLLAKDEKLEDMDLETAKEAQAILGKRKREVVLLSEELETKIPKAELTPEQLLQKISPKKAPMPNFKKFDIKRAAELNKLLRNKLFLDEAVPKYASLADRDQEMAKTDPDRRDAYVLRKSMYEKQWVESATTSEKLGQKINSSLVLDIDIKDKD